MNCSLAPYLSGKKHVGIFGLGISGQGAALLCDKLRFPYEIIDEHKGDLRVPHFENYGICVFSPGFSRRHPWWIQAEALGIPCFTEIDFGAAYSRNRIIAITGTNGKTSTVELITQLLRATGRSALAVGNNGYVLSKAVAEETLTEEGLLVCEVSSFQAEALKLLHPICTLFTNIAPDHLYYHGNFANYIAAKKNLLKQSAGPIICGNALRPYVQEFPDVCFADPIEKCCDRFKEYPCNYSVGQRENFALVQAFAQKLQIPMELFERSLQHFIQPPHRLHCCRTWNGVEFWNDSKGTNLHAVQAALETLKNKPDLHWILGGKSKGENITLFAQTFNRYPNVNCIYFIGETGIALNAIHHQFNAKTMLCHNLNTVFATFKEYTPSPHYLILSPGFSSLDQFKSFEQRGEIFETLAQEVL